ncbi:MAG: diguanylate cyclase, partial [Lachnospiraceae bacterium]|nr:diguanylate cyclase [Lachnospiraceae bacterium]
LYRIGGDEFCVIHHGAKDGMAACVELLEEKAAAWKGKYIGGFTISYGVANKGEKDSVVSLVKLADQRMYACKQAYYKKLA